MTINWIPKLRGKIYCSSACGAGCTKADYDKACKWALDLAKKLGPGWKPKASENLGWFSSVVHKSGKMDICIHEQSKNVLRYVAYANYGIWIGKSTNPFTALQSVINQAIKEKNRIEEILKEITVDINP